MADEAFRPKARRPRGLIDRRGAMLSAERALVAKIGAVYEAWGFEPLETSAFEYADALGKFLPDQDRPNEGVFALQDDDEQWLALRYDLTAPLARFAAEHYDQLPKPYRRWQSGPVWRNEKPGPGRFRQFVQCDADTVGSASPAADAEMIAMACAALEAAGVPRGQYVLKASTRRLLDGLLERIAPPGADAMQTRLTILRAIDKLDRLGIEGVRLLLGEGRKDESGDFTKGAGLAADAIAQVEAFLLARDPESRSVTIENLAKAVGDTQAGAAGVAELREIDAALSGLGVGQDQAIIDPTVVRGLEYYTGAVFEAELLIEAKDEKGNLIRFGSVGGGGRYDDLVSRFRGEAIPATGFSVGVSRLLAALEAIGQGAAEPFGPVVVLVMDKSATAEYFAMAAELRNAGVAAEVYLGSAGMKAQLKYADKRRAPAAVIVGGDELAAGTITVKNLILGDKMAELAGDDREAWNKLREQVQVSAPRADLAATVKDVIAAAKKLLGDAL